MLEDAYKQNQNIAVIPTLRLPLPTDLHKGRAGALAANAKRFGPVRVSNAERPIHYYYDLLRIAPEAGYLERKLVNHNHTL